MPVAVTWYRHSVGRSGDMAAVVAVVLLSLVQAEIGRVEEPYVHRVSSKGDHDDLALLPILEIEVQVVHALDPVYVPGAVRLLSLASYQSGPE